jgi:hypothetical protein
MHAYRTKYGRETTTADRNVTVIAASAGIQPRTFLDTEELERENCKTRPHVMQYSREARRCFDEAGNSFPETYATRIGGAERDREAAVRTQASGATETRQQRRHRQTSVLSEVADGPRVPARECAKLASAKR